MCNCVQHYEGFKDQNSGPYACAPSTSPSESLPQPCEIYIFLSCVTIGLVLEKSCKHY